MKKLKYLIKFCGLHVGVFFVIPKVHWRKNAREFLGCHENNNIDEGTEVIDESMYVCDLEHVC